MSQKMQITGLKHIGASVFIGHDRFGNRLANTKDPEKIINWLCDGWRRRFNEFRAMQPKWKFNEEYKEGDPIETKWLPNGFLGGAELIPAGSMVESKARNTSLVGIPKCIFHVAQVERTEWIASCKRQKTSGGSRPGFKSYRQGQSFVCWNEAGTNGGKYVKTGKNSGYIRITGRIPKQYQVDGASWELRIKVSNSQEVRPYTSVRVNWTKRTLVLVNAPAPIPREETGKDVGLDMGVVHTVTTNHGEHLEIPKPTEQEVARLVSLQKKLARSDRMFVANHPGKKAGQNPSKRRKALKQEIARLQGHISNRRDHFAHNISKQLVVNYDTIAVEDLKVKNMSQGKGQGKKALNKHIRESYWGSIRQCIEYKAAASGVEFVAVDPAYTSQTCNACGHVSRENRKAQDRFVCVECGHTDNADINAAKNILRRGKVDIAAQKAKPSNKVKAAAKA